MQTSWGDGVSSDPIRQILLAVFYIARSAPKKRQRYAGQAKVPWSEVERIRGALSQLGIDLHSWDVARELERLEGAVAQSIWQKEVV